MCSFVVRCFSTASLSTTSFFFYSAKACATFFAATFPFFEAVDYTVKLSAPLLVPTPSFMGSHHSAGQLPMISYTLVVDTKYCSFLSFCTLIEKLWKSALKSTKAINCLRKVGDNLGYRLITILRSISIKF